MSAPLSSGWVNGANCSGPRAWHAGVARYRMDTGRRMSSSSPKSAAWTGSGVWAQPKTTRLLCPKTPCPPVHVATVSRNTGRMAFAFSAAVRHSVHRQRRRRLEPHHLAVPLRQSSGGLRPVRALSLRRGLFLWPRVESGGEATVMECQHVWLYQASGPWAEGWTCVCGFLTRVRTKSGCFIGGPDWVTKKHRKPLTADPETKPMSG